MSKHRHIYRAISGAGYRCIDCGWPTVTRPPKEQMASYKETCAKGLTRDERATYQALVARGVSFEDARESALDGVHVDDVRRYG